MLVGGETAPLAHSCFPFQQRRCHQPCSTSSPAQPRRLSQAHRQQRGESCRLAAERAYHFEVEVPEGDNPERAFYQFSNYERQTKIVDEARRRRYFESQSDFRKRMESAKFTTIRRAREESFIEPYSEIYEEEPTPFDEMYKEASVFGSKFADPRASFDGDSAGFAASFAGRGTSFGAAGNGNGLPTLEAAQKTNQFQITARNPVLNSVMGWEQKNRGNAYPKTVKKAMTENAQDVSERDPFAPPKRKPSRQAEAAPAASQQMLAPAGKPGKPAPPKGKQNPKLQPKVKGGGKGKKTSKRR